MSVKCHVLHASAATSISPISIPHHFLFILFYYCYCYCCDEHIMTLVVMNYVEINLIPSTFFFYFSLINQQHSIGDWTWKKSTQQLSIEDENVSFDLSAHAEHYRRAITSKTQLKCYLKRAACRQACKLSFALFFILPKSIARLHNELCCSTFSISCHPFIHSHYVV